MSKFDDWLKFGVASALDLPTEGVTPSSYPSGTGDNKKTETYHPNNATPTINGGFSSMQFPTMWVVAGIGALLVAKALKVI